MTGDAVLTPGWVDIEGSRIVAVGPADEVPSEVANQVLVPGFVDLHVHGGGGGSFTAHDTEGALRGIRFHRAHGTTTSMASLVTGDLDALTSSVTLLASLVETNDLVGIHLEGPWLSREQCGAHDPSLLRLPEVAEVRALLAAGRGAIRMVTLAPELPGAMESIAEILQAGSLVALGHTAADYVTTQAAINAGATVATHLFNAMKGMHHREPGPIAALLGDPRVTLELIGDGLHVHSALIDVVLQAAGPERIALVTDAMAATGMPDGHYLLGSVSVDVMDGTATVSGTNTIAGSTATMDAVFRRAVGPDPTNVAALRRAVTMTSTTPARALGLSQVGRIAPGFVADVVVLDAAHAVTGVLRRGTWVESAR